MKFQHKINHPKTQSEIAHAAALDIGVRVEVQTLAGPAIGSIAAPAWAGRVKVRVLHSDGTEHFRASFKTSDVKLVAT